MSSLKEIKERIASVRSTRKITSAMKMVAAAKLHRAQNAMGAMQQYSEAMQRITQNLVSGDNMPDVTLAQQREIGGVTIVVFASNGTLCGAFNNNTFKELRKTAAQYAFLPPEKVRIVAIGKQIAEDASGAGMNVVAQLDDIAEKPVYAVVAHLAQQLIDEFSAGQTDRVEIIYHRFHSAGSQSLVSQTLLPVSLENRDDNPQQTQYILEPSREELIGTLIPREVKLSLYTASLSSWASEHAARMMAMQTATDNADELIGSLGVEYNKSRQQAITSELLDIMGGQNNG